MTLIEIAVRVNTKRVADMVLCKFKRKVWDDDSYICVSPTMNDWRIMLSRCIKGHGGRKLLKYNPTIGDLLASDWEEYKSKDESNNVQV